MSDAEFTKGHGGIDRAQRLALLAGVVGLAACLAAGLLWPARFYPSYLVAYLFWAWIALGSLAILMLHNLVGGSWGLPIRRPMEAAAGTLPLLALLFVPLTFGIKRLYPWADPMAVARSPALQHKAIYLNENAFLMRAGGYFALWFALAFLLIRLSKREERAGGGDGARLWLQSLSGPGGSSCISCRCRSRRSTG